MQLRSFQEQFFNWSSGMTASDQMNATVVDRRYRRIGRFATRIRG
jgi:hypothetical protein